MEERCSLSVQRCSQQGLDPGAVGLGTGQWLHWDRLRIPLQHAEVVTSAGFSRALTKTPRICCEKFFQGWYIEMKLKRLPRQRGEIDKLTGIAPIYKVSFDGSASLIGTGFWVTEMGHLITAWHVIDDNIGRDGVDYGPIYAIQTLPDRTVIPRVIVQTDKHKTFDLALSKTHHFDGTGKIKTSPLPLTLDEPEVGAPITTFSFLSTRQDFANEKYPGRTAAEFNGLFAIPALRITYELAFAARAGSGYVTEIFSEARDAVMMPFPCIRSDMPIYGANSGGPVFDKKGRVCAVNCSSYEGSDISFHVPLRGILDLGSSGIEFIPEDPMPRFRTIAELGLAERTPFHPPLVEVFFTFRQRLILRPFHFILNCIAWGRWLLLR